LSFVGGLYARNQKQHIVKVKTIITNDVAWNTMGARGSRTSLAMSGLGVGDLFLSAFSLFFLVLASAYDAAVSNRIARSVPDGNVILQAN
jgi:hypothetical protein